jgi:hypothetical protein
MAAPSMDYITSTYQVAAAKPWSIDHGPLTIQPSAIQLWTSIPIFRSNFHATPDRNYSEKITFANASGNVVEFLKN